MANPEEGTRRCNEVQGQSEAGSYEVPREIKFEQNLRVIRAAESCPTECAVRHLKSEFHGVACDVPDDRRQTCRVPQRGFLTGRILGARLRMRMESPRPPRQVWRRLRNLLRRDAPAVPLRLPRGRRGTLCT